MITQDLLNRSEYGYDDSYLITPEEYLKYNPLFETFIECLNFHHKKVLCLKNKDNNKKKKVFYLIIFTHENMYEITTKYYPDKKPYISVDLVCRREKPMECWKRLSDLSDGELTAKKLIKIICQILEKETEILEIDYNNETKNTVGIEN